MIYKLRWWVKSQKTYGRNYSQDPSRKRVSSLERKNEQAKKQLIQEALGSYKKTISQTQKEVSCSAKDLIAVIEIETQNSAKTKSIRTQCRKEDFEEEFQDIEKRQAFIMRINKLIRKCKDITVNLTRLQSLKNISILTNRSKLLKGKLQEMKIQMIKVTVQLVTHLTIVTIKKPLIKSSLMKIFS